MRINSSFRYLFHRGQSCIEITPCVNWGLWQTIGSLLLGLPSARYWRVVEAPRRAVVNVRKR